MRRSQHSKELHEEHGFTYVHAFDDELVIAGQGTIGLEIAECHPESTVVVVPIGGGGLISGIAIAIKAIAAESPCLRRSGGEHCSGEQIVASGGAGRDRISSDDR